MQAILNTLFEKQHLPQPVAREALVEIASGRATPSQVASFITVYLFRPVTVEELTGFREALLEFCQRVDLSDYEPIDLCGTGGDNRNTFNISTVSAFVAAGAGVMIAKHGNYAVSSQCGSSNVLEFFGHRFSNKEADLRADLERVGICFLHAPLFHPALKEVAPVRRELRVKTFFNMLGPLINPADPARQVLGVYRDDIADLYSAVLSQNGKSFSIIHSLDGYDEISLTGAFRYLTNHQDYIFSPAQLGLSRAQPSELEVGSVSEAADVFYRILQGRATTAQHEVVIANAALAISLHREILYQDALVIARESLESGKALSTFKKFMRI